MDVNIEKAIDKIDKEAEKIGGDHAKIICQHIIDNYLGSEENAKKVMEKNLNACISDIKSKARAQASNGMAMITDDVVYSWVVDFYGFTKSSKKDNNIIDLFDIL